MALGSVTYNTLSSSIASYIAQNANNVGANWNNVPDCFKANYAYKTTRFGATSTNGQPHSSYYQSEITERINNSTAVPNYSSTNASHILTEMKKADYVPTSKYPDNENISMPKFISYFDNICKFFVKNVGYVTSVHNVNTTLMVYRTDGYFDNTTLTFNSSIDDLIRALPVNNTDDTGVIQILRKRLNSLLRHKPCMYVFDMS